jgi:hypothetical protein
MSYDLSKILNQTLDNIGAAIGEVVGKEIPAEKSQSNTQGDAELPWYQNIINGFIGGFSKTDGGKTVITTAGKKTLVEELQGFLIKPYVWIGLAVIFGILIFKKR